MFVHDNIAAWLAQDRSGTADLGADPDGVIREAGRLLETLSKGSGVAMPSPEAPERQIEILHAMIGLLTKSPGGVELRTLDRAFELLETPPSKDWPVHRDHLLSELALFCWREGRARREAAASGTWRRRVGALLRRGSDGVLTSQLGVLSERAGALLDLPASSRRVRAAESELRDPELLLSVAQLLVKSFESDPREVLNEAEFFYNFLETLAPPVGLFDEHEYFLGEFALLAATACRVLFRRDDAHRWIARSEASCIGTVGAEGQSCRLAFQKLALRTEDRQYDEVLELAPKWSRTAKNQGLPEEEITFLFLHAAALREVGRLDEAVSVFQEIEELARRVARTSFEALAECNLVECVRAQGDLPRATEHAERAVALLEDVGDTHLAKHRWLLGGILREQCKLSEALSVYRAVRREYEAHIAGVARKRESNRQP